MRICNLSPSAVAALLSIGALPAAEAFWSNFGNDSDADAPLFPSTAAPASGPPSASPTPGPSVSPSTSPILPPSKAPSRAPSRDPSASPSRTPSRKPSASPTAPPSPSPTAPPSLAPSSAPSQHPSVLSTTKPSRSPSASPTAPPTQGQELEASLFMDMVTMSMSMSDTTTAPPSRPPSRPPSKIPSSSPTGRPSRHPSTSPTESPSRTPSSPPSRPPTEDAIILGMTYNDLDEDGRYDASADAVLPGVVVELYSCATGSMVADTRADQEGNFALTVAADALPDERSVKLNESARLNACHYIQYDVPETILPHAKFTAPINGETGDMILTRGQRIDGMKAGMFSLPPEPTSSPTSWEEWTSELPTIAFDGTYTPTGQGMVASLVPGTYRPTAEDEMATPIPTPEGGLASPFPTPAFSWDSTNLQKITWAPVDEGDLLQSQLELVIEEVPSVADPKNQLVAEEPEETEPPAIDPLVIEEPAVFDPLVIEVAPSSAEPLVLAEPTVLDPLVIEEPEAADPKNPPMSVPAIKDKAMKVQALEDKATTFTGKPILAHVLFNDFIYNGEDAGIIQFGANVVLKEVVSNGIHGTCKIKGGDAILYTPDAGYSGPDKCGYQVCSKSEGRECNYASLSITVAKQAVSEEIVVDNEPRPEAPLEEIAPDALPLVIDPEALLTEEVWNEVHESTTVVEEESVVNVNFTKPEDGVLSNFTSNCTDGEVLLTFELQTDKHGEDVTWELFREYGDNSSVLVASRGPYGHRSYDQVDICVPSPSLFRFIIHDSWGDGLCGGQETCGYYKLYLDGRAIVHAEHYAHNNTHSISVGYDPTPSMTQRDSEYLHAHNWRRKEWHEKHNASYVPLIWSPKLAEESMKWAIELLDACDSDGIEHEPGVPEGENLAKNKGLVEDWGQLYHPENITRRWVEREIGWPYPENAHLTQALWRSSRYLGCAESEKDYNGGKCRVQVCRYVRAGNCDMASYNSTEGENWLVPMLRDTSPCEPSCPPEGCY